MISLFVLFACSGSAPPTPAAEPTPVAETTPPADPPADAPVPSEGVAEAAEPTTTGFRLTSPDFAAGASMPTHLTCEGDDTSPALVWHDAPEGTKSFALIVTDPDAPDPARPRMTWVHWVVYDIPFQTTGLAAGAAATGMPEGSREGTNDFRKTGYGGPCPPTGRHRYVHTVYALDTVLGDQGALARVPLGQAMEGHILGEAELIGTYEKATPDPGTPRSGR